VATVKAHGSICLAICLLLAGEAAAADTVVLWHSYRAEERQALEQTVTAFNTGHPGVQV